jgi:transcriptional regulator with XRE-family HTH domain
MAATGRRVDRATLQGRRQLDELGREIRQARVAAGLSQAEVGRAVRLDGSRISRIERGLVRGVSLITLSRLATVVGLDLSVRAHPAGQPLRDRAHLVLLERLRSRLHADARWKVEVPLPLPGDQRAWDAVAWCGSRKVGIEVETRVTDLQAAVRRATLKQRDGGAGRLVLVLADTRWNRRVLRENAAYLAPLFDVHGRAALRALEQGRDPGGNAIVLL